MNDTQLDIEKLTADVRRLEYGPADVIVVTVPEPVRISELETVIRERVEPTFPDNKVMVLTGGRRDAPERRRGEPERMIDLLRLRPFGLFLERPPRRGPEFWRKVFAAEDRRRRKRWGLA
jgi:hypothetical protein